MSVVNAVYLFFHSTHIFNGQHKKKKMENERILKSSSFILLNLLFLINNFISLKNFNFFGLIIKENSFSNERKNYFLKIKQNISKKNQNIQFLYYDCIQFNFISRRFLLLFTNL